jgi:hypothetical protein
MVALVLMRLVPTLNEIERRLGEIGELLEDKGVKVR